MKHKHPKIIVKGSISVLVNCKMLINVIFDTFCLLLEIHIIYETIQNHYKILNDSTVV